MYNLTAKTEYLLLDQGTENYHLGPQRKNLIPSTAKKDNLPKSKWVGFNVHPDLWRVTGSMSRARSNLFDIFKDDRSSDLVSEAGFHHPHFKPIVHFIPNLERQTHAIFPLGCDMSTS